MTNDDLLLREDRGRVAVLTINRPGSLNAFNHDLGDRLLERLAELSKDDSIGAVVLTGAGDRAFCAGTDLKDPHTHAVSSADEHLADVKHISADDYFFGLLEFRKPIICAVNGFAIGIGFQIQFCTDVILAADNARFRLPQVRLGVMPAYGGAPRLAQWVGRSRAAEIALTGRWVEAEEAVRIGLALAQYPVEEIVDRAVELASVMAANSPASLALTKESLIGALEMGSLRVTSVADNYRFMALSQTKWATETHKGWRDDWSSAKASAVPAK